MSDKTSTTDQAPLATAQARSAHTPGPWTDIQFGDRPQSVSAINGAISICSFNAALYKIHPDQARANARLIAAAPNLLLACEEVLAQIKNTTIYPRCVLILSAAIKKARGQ